MFTHQTLEHLDGAAINVVAEIVSILFISCKSGSFIKVVSAAFFDLTRVSVWGPPRMFPPGGPLIPAMLHTPDLQMNRCQSCVDLKLTYNPNTEGGHHTKA